MRTIPALILSSALLISCASNPKNNEPSIISVIWLNEDGTILQKEKCNKEEANSLQYMGDTPKKQKTSQYTYYFNGWSGPVEQDNGDIVYTATYREEINKYTVIWKNYDGTVLEADYDVLYGTMPSYDGDIPTRTTDAQYTYDFRDWSPAVQSVTGDIVYMATYYSSLNYYNFYLDPAGGTCSTESLRVGYNQYYSLPTPTKVGYTFNGWYNNNTKVAQTGYWSYSSNIYLTAKWTIINYTITYILNGGTNNSSNPSSYTIQSSEIIFCDPSKTGYTFLGWFDGNNNSITSITTGSTGNVKLNARWNDGNVYSVTLDPNNGSVSDTLIEVQYNHNYVLPTPTREGYIFKGWYDGANKISDSDTWKFTSNKTFVAYWSIINYSINYTLNGGTNVSNNPSTYTIESSVTFSTPSKTGYTFLGWFDASGNQITSIVAGTTGALSIEARWLANLNNLSVASEDSSKGTVAITSGSGYSDETITVVATPIDDCVFKGWYHESNLVSDDTTYTFIMPTNDYSLVAKFCTKEEWDMDHGVVPVLSQDGKTITYGLYPQNKAYGSSLISALDALTVPEPNGWYFYKGEYYAKPSGTSSWFKCEPITWNVLKNNKGKYYIVSSVLLDVCCYYSSTSDRIIDGQTIYPNNYEHSDIRAWLNNDFYNTAFALGNSYIQTTTVDNTASTTASSSNSYACINTEDKVFLPSYKDYYGFSNSTSSTDKRSCKLTDWALARGAWHPTSNYSYRNCGVYWTRSPGSSSPNDVWYVSFAGGMGASSSITSTDDCVRPGLSIIVS